ncbi:MAG: cell division protein FtsA [Bacilli bacterium]|nr:cell division protein FtsA [Bacilli bacterium]
MRKIMACLDVGSDSIKLVVGEMVKKKLNILAACEEPSLGVDKGIVQDANALLEPVSNVIRKCEEIIGLKIRQMIVSVPAVNATYAVVNGSIEIENEGNLIEGKDVIRVMQKAIKSRRSENYEYISMMPTSFALDDDRVVKDPKGLTSKVLSVKGVMVSTPKKNIYPVLAVLERLNVDVLDIGFNAIGDYFEMKTKEYDKEIGAIVNLGADVTTLSIFNKGVLTNSNVISLGGRNIDNDLSFIYKISSPEAKGLKEKFALAHKNMSQSSDFVEVENNFSEKIRINQFEISEIVMSRLEEILNLCKKEINYLTKKEISYIIFTGGLTECKDFNLILEETFGKKAVLGSINEIGVRNNKYSSCIGLIKFYAYNAHLKSKDFSIFSIEEQQELSGANLDIQDESMIGKLFGYIFNS